MAADSAGADEVLAGGEENSVAAANEAWAVAEQAVSAALVVVSAALVVDAVAKRALVAALRGDAAVLVALVAALRGNAAALRALVVALRGVPDPHRTAISSAGFLGCPPTKGSRIPIPPHESQLGCSRSRLRRGGFESQLLPSNRRARGCRRCRGSESERSRVLRPSRGSCRSRRVQSQFPAVLWRQGAAAGAAVANRNDPRYSGAQGALTGYAAGFNRTLPSARYGTAMGVRGNFDHYDLYGSNWNVDHPGAWMAAGWGANDAWRAATWNSVGAWMGYPQTAPIYYDYGNNVTYEDNSVYVNGQDAGTTQQYYGQASALAQSGAAAEAPSDGDWLPLGVFALTKDDAKDSIVTIQLAVNKQGVIRGNYTDTKTGKTMVIQGAVDKQTQRVAFTVGDNKSNLIETGLYNLTKDEAPALVHVSNDKTAQYLLVRLDKDKTAGAANEQPDN